jgi:DNA (cytosine-5)-methyltransferase 1
MPRKNSYITVTDQFCGAGGSSIGATRAGATVRLAMNHWKLAIQTHNTNFPNVDHDCTDISAVDPRRYPSTNILITSPECTNHSLAKGKPRRLYSQDLFGNALIDPAEERSRATMWDVPRFAEYHEYELIVVENVVDAAKWRLWDSWLHAMHALGYEHQVVYYNSMFAWPTPQTRDRIYTIFWKRGNKRPDLEFRPPAFCSACGKNVEAIQTWKKRTHWGRYKAQYFYRCPTCHQEVSPFYYAAFNAIDWTIQAERIGDRKRPLKDKTLERIRYGLETYGRKPLIVTGRYTSGVECRVKDAGAEPLPTQPGDASHGVVFPWLVETGYTHAPGNRATSTADPGRTQTTHQTLGVVGFLSRQYGGQADPKYLSLGLDEPTGAVTTWDHHALLSAPMMISLNDFDPRIFPAGELPMGTQTTQDKWGLVNPAFIAEMHGTSKAAGIDEPLMCLTAGGGHHALLSANAFLTYYYGSSNQASGVTDPVRTVTGVDRVGLVGALENLTVEDLTFRMLQPHEIGKAMAFPEPYVVLGTNREKVRQYGNAVTPPVMEMLLKRCVDTLL